MTRAERDYIPAAGQNWALSLYDPVVKLLGADRARQELLKQAVLEPGQRVLDIGCGTGTFAVSIKRAQPNVGMVGLDPDPKALSRAKDKAFKAAVSVQFDEGFSDHLPYGDASFDRVLSTFMFHHLANDVKAKTLAEVRRVLRPNGSLHLLDFSGRASEHHGVLSRVLHASESMQENSEERILALLRKTGFADARTLKQSSMLFGLLAVIYVRAVA